MEYTSSSKIISIRVFAYEMGIPKYLIENLTNGDKSIEEIYYEIISKETFYNVQEIIELLLNRKYSPDEQEEATGAETIGLIGKAKNIIGKDCVLVEKIEKLTSKLSYLVYELEPKVAEDPLKFIKSVHENNRNKVYYSMLEFVQNNKFFDDEEKTLIKTLSLSTPSKETSKLYCDFIDECLDKRSYSFVNKLQSLTVKDIKKFEETADFTILI